jgi:hypothetical protein
MCCRIRELGINLLFTLYSPEKKAQVYSPARIPGVRTFSTLAGYVPDSLQNYDSAPIASRRLDFGYRGREVPYWLGDLGRDKVRIVQRFHERAISHSLTFDVSCLEEDRIYGEAWPKFIESCKAMLGTESGSSITDFDGSAQRSVLEYLKNRPDAGYEEVHAALLRSYEGNIVHNCISPRAFETAALRTAMVLFPGEYSGLLQPWVHYIPLAKDFSNFSQVVDSINDDDLLNTMVNRAHRDLIASGRFSYSEFVRDFDNTLDQFATHHGSNSKRAYEKAIQEPVPKPPLPWRSRLKRLAERVGVPPWVVRKLKSVANQAMGKESGA